MVLWWREGSERLTPQVRDAIAHAEVVYVSAASAWEVAIKVRIGKVRIPAPFGRGVRDSSFTPLPIEFHHAELVAELPDHHTDPFDRILVAQARAEGLTLVTHDRAIEPYQIAVLWV